MYPAQIVVALGLVSCGPVWASAPDTVAGAVFTENRTFIVATRPPQTGQTTSITNSFLLNPDSTFVCVFGNYPAKTGRWSYQKLGSDSAFLVLDGFDQRLSAFDRTLNFSTGSFSDSGSGIVSRTFSLTPFSGRSRVANVSSRSFIRARDSAAAGFVVGAEGAIVLVRVAGPSLADFGVNDAIRSPRLEIVRAGKLIASGGAWSSGDNESIEQATRFAAAVGAFPFRPGSSDTALVLSLPPGAYTANASSVDPAESGQVLIEVYVLP